MADTDALRIVVSPDCELLLAGIRRERDTSLTADVLLSAGGAQHAERATINTAAGRAAFLNALPATIRVSPQLIEQRIIAALPDALSQVQDGGDARGGMSQATKLVALADDAELWHTPAGDAYITIDTGGHREHWPLKSKASRQWLARRFYADFDSAPNASALQDALGVLEGRAVYEGAERPVFVRLAQHGDAIYVDLADDAWRAVEVTAAGWQIVSDPPVRFRRSRGMAAHCLPMRGGSVDELRAFVNLSGDDWTLLVAWLIGTLRPSGPFPLLELHGE